MNVGKREKWWEVVKDGKKPEGGQHHCKKDCIVLFPEMSSTLRKKPPSARHLTLESFGSSVRKASQWMYVASPPAEHPVRKAWKLFSISEPLEYKFVHNCLPDTLASEVESCAILQLLFDITGKWRPIAIPYLHFIPVVKIRILGFIVAQDPSKLNLVFHVPGRPQHWSLTWGTWLKITAPASTLQVD